MKAVDPRCPEMHPLRKRRTSVVRQAHGQAQLEMVLRPARRQRADAAEVVRNHLVGVLPPGTPAHFRSVDRAWFQSAGRRRIAVADLTMVDGLRATVQVSEWSASGCAWGSHRYSAWEGPALFFEGGRWQRDVEGVA